MSRLSASTLVGLAAFRSRSVYADMPICAMPSTYRAFAGGGGGSCGDDVLMGLLPTGWAIASLVHGAPV